MDYNFSKLNQALIYVNALKVLKEYYNCSFEIKGGSFKFSNTRFDLNSCIDKLKVLLEVISQNIAG